MAFTGTPSTLFLQIQCNRPGIWEPAAKRPADAGQPGPTDAAGAQPAEIAPAPHGIASASGAKHGKPV